MLSECGKLPNETEIFRFFVQQKRKEKEILVCDRRTEQAKETRQKANNCRWNNKNVWNDMDNTHRTGDTHKHATLIVQIQEMTCEIFSACNSSTLLRFNVLLSLLTSKCLNLLIFLIYLFSASDVFGTAHTTVERSQCTTFRSILDFGCWLHGQNEQNEMIHKSRNMSNVKTNETKACRRGRQQRQRNRPEINGQSPFTYFWISHIRIATDFDRGVNCWHTSSSLPVCCHHLLSMHRSMTHNRFEFSNPRLSC